MRLLAGMPLEQDVREPEEVGDRGTRVQIQAGPWLASVLDGLRSPEGLAAIDPGAALRAELRADQRAAVKWLHWLHTLGLSGCLADDMGLSLMHLATNEPESGIHLVTRKVFVGPGC